MLSVELGLYLLARVLPGRPARDAWTLFGGYPYAEAAGHVERVVERLEAELDAVAGALGGGDVDVAPEGGGEGVGDQLDRGGLVGVHGRPD